MSPRGKRIGEHSRASAVIRLVLLGLLVLAAAGLVAGCGGEGGSAAKESGLQSESHVGSQEAAEAASRAQQKSREAESIKRENAQLAVIRKRREAVIKAQEAEEAGATPEKKHKTHSGKTKPPSSAHAKKTQGSKKTGKGAPVETAAEKEARAQFAKEEAQEAASFKRRAQQEAAK